jgi:hypothetical protein
MTTGLRDGGCGGGGLLTSAGLARLVLLADLAHAVLDHCAGDKIFEHFGLLVGSNRLIWMSRSCA